MRPGINIPGITPSDDDTTQSPKNKPENKPETEAKAETTD